MYHAAAAQPARLVGSDYANSESLYVDRRRFATAPWHWVCAAERLRQVGDQFATELFIGPDGQPLPILVRREAEGIRAFLNVCAHRHCQIAPEGISHQSTLKCPYHGWCYGEDGRTRKIPGAKNFPHLQREAYRLRQFDVRIVGGLVLVRGPAADQNSDWTEDTLGIELAKRTDPQHWSHAFRHRVEYPCDWKIVVEGSLESYHLDEVHAATFGHDPGEAHTEHVLKAVGTAFQTDFRQSSWLARLEERSIRYIAGDFHPRYQHLHLFPNIMASLTDTLSLVYRIDPIGPASCRMRVDGWIRRSVTGRPGGGWIQKRLAKAAEKLAVKVLDEDAEIFPFVQRGIEAAVDVGDGPTRLFGRCEERLTWFHRSMRPERFADDPPERPTGDRITSTASDGGATA